MKNLFLLAAFLFAATLPGHAQLNIQKSEIFKDKKKHTVLSSATGDGQGGLITVRTFYGGLIKTPKGYYVSHFDEGLNLISEKEFEIDKNFFRGVMVKDDKVYIFDFGKDRKNDEFDFDVLTAPISTFEFERTTLFSISEDQFKKYFGFGIGFIPITNMGSMDNNVLGEVVFSDNKEYFAISLEMKNDKQETQRVIVYSTDFQKIYEKDIKLNSRDRLFHYENVQVGDDGSVYLLGQYLGRKKNKDANYNYALVKVNAEGMKETSFKSEEHYVASLTLLRKGEKLSCVGFYSERNDHRYKGVVRFDLDPGSLSIAKKSFLPFSDQFLFDKYGKVKDKELRNLSYRDTYMFDNGDIVLNAEEYYIRTHTSMSPTGGMSTNTTYHFEDIVSCKISANGELIWARNILKRQVAGVPSSNYKSYCAAYKNGNVHFFLNARDNVREKNDGRFIFKDKRKGKLDLFQLTIDQSGEFSFKDILPHKESEVVFYVEYGEALEERGELILVGRDGRKKRLIKISY